MYIKNIYLENFRSYSKKKFEFGDDVTVVVGPNTAGKSNLLEAMFLLAFGRSPRADLDREMLKNNAKLGFVRATTYNTENQDLEVVLTDKGKRFRVNGIGRRLLDFSKHFHVVLFSPEDLNLVTGSPDLRRRFLDFAIGGINYDYVRALREYNKVRKRRNHLLEKINQNQSSQAELGFWDAKLLEHGASIQDKRREFLSEINHKLRFEGLELGYAPSGLTAERLLEFRPREIAAGTSLVGPHRDDFSFLAGDRNLSSHGSRGEHRQAVLALKSAELEFIQKRSGSRPTFLLDDIFSELDEKNRARVFDLIGGGQTIISTTDFNQVPQEVRENVRVIKL